MERKLFFQILLILLSAIGSAKTITVFSPDKSLKLEVTVGDKISYSLSKDGIELLKPSFISMKLDRATLGDHPVIKKIIRTTVDEMLYPVIRIKEKSGK